MQSRRNHSSRPSISGPFPTDYPLPMSSPTKSPPVASTSQRSRQGVMSATLPLTRGWLNRSSSSSSGSSIPYAPSKPTRISEPKLDAGNRSGILGAGATVVRTPQDALAGTSAASAIKSPYNAEGVMTERGSPGRAISPNSPPLPPIPDFDDDELDSELLEVQEEVQEDTRSVRSTTPSRPTRAIPPAPLQEELCEPSPMVRRPSLKSISPLESGYFPPVPSLPANLAPSPSQVPFEAILISPPPTTSVDPSKVIVSLETSTQTYRTTLSTLTSRPSLLGSYLKSFFPAKDEDEDEMSVYSTQSDENTSFHSIFHQHLTSSGLSVTSTNMHVFLDRPSAPYAHILTYLRTLPSTPEQPAILPRPVQLTSSSSTRLEALLELRDEARYLDLDELYKLCQDEIRLRYSNALGLHSHSRGMSSVSITSSRSLGTLRETGEGEMEEQQEHATTMRRHSSRRQKLAGHERARSKDSGVGTASPGSFRAPMPDSTEHGELSTAPPMSAPVSVPGLRERIAMKARGRSETRRANQPPAGDWI
ncbi:hypothetical protein EIP91_006681 [Steccherinum ochraceum]|uniref:BTB domain-containing protein n=1 Tax=Steccherinum ochraceum TaxID=92696 RepID=A0A4R0S109_9APHY|nr:hypothetical protein EIP91_006681 [Steccherinum ochraceum]